MAFEGHDVEAIIAFNGRMQSSKLSRGLRA